MQEIDAGYERDLGGVPHLLLPDQVGEHGEARQDVPEEVPAETADLGEGCRHCCPAVVVEERVPVHQR